jgi:hypothetical protein
MKSGLRIGLIGICLASIPVCALACTIFTTTGQGRVLVGNNEAWFFRPPTQVRFVVPEPGKYGRVYVGFKGETLAQGGLNDQGLCFDWVADLRKTGWKPSPDKRGYDGESLSMYILEQAATVDEALGIYQRFNEPFFRSAQIMLADRAGNAAIVGWNNGDVRIIRKDGHLLALGWEAEMVERLLGDGPAPTVAQVRNALAQVLQRGLLGTVYSVVYDLERGVIYLDDFLHTGQHRILDLREELAKGDYSLDFPDLTRTTDRQRARTRRPRP